MVTALNGNDSLAGGNGRDTLLGGNGDDVFVFDVADSSVSGGLGTDTLQILGNASVTLDLTEDDPLNPGAKLFERFSGIEKIDLTGSANNTVVLSAEAIFNLSGETDTLIVTGNSGDTVRLSGAGWEARGSELVAGITYNRYIGYFGDNAVTVLAGLQVVKGDQIVGANSGSDSIVGGAGADELQGTGAAEVLVGRGGADLLSGAGGNDTLIYDNADVLADGGLGNDVLRLSTSGEIIDLQEAGRPTSGALQPTLAGIEVIDLRGSGSNYLILDSSKAQALAGGTLNVLTDTNDIVFVDGAVNNLTINGGSGSTVSVITADTDSVTVDGDSIVGTSGQDAIKAGNGNDTVDGGAGADILYGGTGDDVIYYDTADLRVFGGTGTDTLVVRSVDPDGNAANTNAGINTVQGDRTQFFQFSFGQGF